MLDLLVIHQESLHSIITVSISLYSHLKSSPADLLYSSAAICPIRCLYLCVLLPRLIFTVTAFTSLMTSVFTLAHTKLELHSLLFCTALFSLLLSLCYITAVPTTGNIFDSIVDTCVLSHCIATVATFPLLRY
jgi:hypothetical protein